MFSFTGFPSVLSMVICRGLSCCGSLFLCFVFSFSLISSLYWVLGYQYDLPSWLVHFILGVPCNQYQKKMGYVVGWLGLTFG